MQMPRMPSSPMRLNTQGMCSCLRSCSLMTGRTSRSAKSMTICRTRSCSSDREKSINEPPAGAIIYRLSYLTQRRKGAKAQGWKGYDCRSTVRVRCGLLLQPVDNSYDTIFDERG